MQAKITAPHAELAEVVGRNGGQYRAIIDEDQCGGLSSPQNRATAAASLRAAKNIALPNN